MSLFFGVFDPKPVVHYWHIVSQPIIYQQFTDLLRALLYSEGGLLHCTDVQGCVATTHEGLYEGLDWLQAEFASRDVKNVVTKPVKESVVSPLSRIQNALKNYLWPPATEVS